MNLQQNAVVEPMIIDSINNNLNTMKATTLIKAYELMTKPFALLAGQAIPSCYVEGDVAVYCIEGEVDLSAAEQTFRLNAGDLHLLKDGTEHSFLGVQNSSLLVTIPL